MIDDESVGGKYNNIEVHRIFTNTTSFRLKQITSTTTDSANHENRVYNVTCFKSNNISQVKIQQKKIGFRFR